MISTSGCSPRRPNGTRRLIDARCIKEKRFSAVQAASPRLDHAVNGPNWRQKLIEDRVRAMEKHPRQINAKGDPMKRRLHLRRRSELSVKSVSARRLLVWLMRGPANAPHPSLGQPPNLSHAMGVLSRTGGVLS